MLLNLDIWHEIISYLDYWRDRRTLCSLAVTSHDISNLALDTLWRGGGSVEAIVSVINSLSPSPNEPFLYHIDDYEDNPDIDNDNGDPSTSSGRMINSWVLNKPIHPATCERALEYLARIRDLTVSQSGSPRDLVWPILSAILNYHRPLLPNLSCLNIYFHIFDRNEYLIPLLSPSINTLLITCERPPKLDAILTFLNIAKVRGCDLEVFEYNGSQTNHHIPEAIILFNNLQSVCFPIDLPSYPMASITIVEFLTSLPSLRFLTCHIGTFSPLTDKDQFYHTNLTDIELGSESADLLHDLFRTCVFPSVTDVLLLSVEPLDMQGFELSCPDTRKLNLDFYNTNPPLGFNDLVPLLSLSIQSFRLSVKEHALTASNLHSFSEAWPNIRSLEIISDTLFDPLPSLVAFSNYPCLNTLNVSLSLVRLLDDIPKDLDFIADVTPQGGGRSPLRTLCLRHWGHGGLPTTEKHVVAERLLRLFPSLAELNFVAGGLYPEDNLREFQEIFVELGTGVEILFDF